MTVNIRRILLISGIISLFMLPSYGQLSLTGEIRPRTEFRNGFKTLLNKEESPAFFTEQRTRLNLNYREDRLEFKLSAQEVRIWGSVNQIYKTDPSLFNMYEAWGKYALTPHLGIQIGRQALDYDNARFLGDLDWAQQGRSHDAVLLSYEDSLGTKIHLGTGFNQNIPFEPGKLSGTLYENMDNYKTMQFLWFHKSYAASKFSFLLFNDGRQSPDPDQIFKKVNFRQTYGLIGQKQLGIINLEGEIYYQGGKDPLGQKTSAWLVSAALTLKTTLTPLTMGLDYLSGSQAGAQTNRAFNPLYGTNHKFYGFMDHFYVGNNHGQAGSTAGLKDFFLKSTFKLTNKSNLLAHFHHFESAVPVYNGDSPGSRVSGSLGEELDLVFTTQLAKNISLNIGYSQMFSTKTSEILKGKSNSEGYQSWAWTMISFKPTLFQGK